VLTVVPIDAIRLSAKNRRRVSAEKVERFRQLYEMGHELPPIKVYCIDDGVFAVSDGRHRLMAQIAAGYRMVVACSADIASRIKSFFQRRFANA
jgi:hypothetical protein